MKEFEIKPFEEGQRLEKLLNQAPKSFIYKMLRKKNIVLNDKKATGQECLAGRDRIKLYLSDDTFDKFSLKPAKETASKKEVKPAEETGCKKRPPVKKVPGRLIPQIVYEDHDILILNKPAGLLSQKAAPQDDSANDFVLDYLLESGQLTREDLLTFRPSICNRLDRNTSGLLTAGKSIRGLQQMAELLKDRTLKKYYLCIVKGKVTKNRHLKGYLKKDPGSNKVEIHTKPFEGADFIETSYIPLKTAEEATLLQVHLITGRSHQIRAHLASIGHPVLGDYKYGDRNVNQFLKSRTGISGQLLHAWKMIMPDGREWTAPPPENFRKAFDTMTDKRG